MSLLFFVELFHGFRILSLRCCVRAMQFLQRDVVLMGAQLSSLGAGQRWRQAEQLHSSMAMEQLGTNRICGNALVSAYDAGFLVIFLGGLGFRLVKTG